MIDEEGEEQRRMKEHHSRLQVTSVFDSIYIALDMRGV